MLLFAQPTCVGSSRSKDVSPLRLVFSQLLLIPLPFDRRPAPQRLDAQELLGVGVRFANMLFDLSKLLFQLGLLREKTRHDLSGGSQVIMARSARPSCANTTTALRDDRLLFLPRGFGVVGVYDFERWSLSNFSARLAEFRLELAFLFRSLIRKDLLYGPLTHPLIAEYGNRSAALHAHAGGGEQCVVALSARDEHQVSLSLRLMPLPSYGVVPLASWKIFAVKRTVVPSSS